MPGGGGADVYLDGKLDRTVEGHPDEDSWNTSDAACHAFRLKPGTHKIRLVVLGEPNAGWPGSAISLEGLVVLR